MNNTDKTLEEKIYRVLLVNGPSSKEIAKVLREQIETLKEKYDKVNDDYYNVPLNIDDTTNSYYYNLGKIHVLRELGELLK